MQKVRAIKKAPIIITVLVLLLVACIVYFIHKFILSSKQSGKPAVAQQITLISPPPPPPPPPKPEPEPEPKQIEEVVEKVPETPTEAPQDDAPAGEDLGLDAEGGAGSDSFGLVGHKGGKGIGLGKAGHYEVMIKEKLIDLIYADEELKYLSYSGVIKVWIDGNGKVEKFVLSLDDSSPKVEKLLSAIIKSMEFKSGPPIEAAGKAIKLKINSKV